MPGVLADPSHVALQSLRSLADLQNGDSSKASKVASGSVGTNAGLVPDDQPFEVVSGIHSRQAQRSSGRKWIQRGDGVRNGVEAPDLAAQLFGRGPGVENGDGTATKKSGLGPFVPVFPTAQSNSGTKGPEPQPQPLPPPAPEEPKPEEPKPEEPKPEEPKPEEPKPEQPKPEEPKPEEPKPEEPKPEEPRKTDPQPQPGTTADTSGGVEIPPPNVPIPAHAFLAQYTDARAAVAKDLDTFRGHLDDILRMLDTQVHPEDFEKIFTNNQCARQYNAAIDNKDKTKLAPLMDRKGHFIEATRATIEELEKLDPDTKREILVSLGTSLEQLHIFVTERGMLRPNEVLLTRQLRVAVGLPAVPINVTII